MKFCVEKKISVLRTDSASTHTITLFIRFYCFATSATEAKRVCRDLLKKTHLNKSGSEHETQFTTQRTSVTLLSKKKTSNKITRVFQAEGKKESVIYGSPSNSGSNKNLRWQRISGKEIDHTY